MLVLGASEDPDQATSECSKNLQVKKSLVGRIVDIDMIYVGSTEKGHIYRVNPKYTNYHDCFFKEEELQTAFMSTWAHV